ncbi:MAG: hypothetical protein HYT42_01335 [Candidatus Sungbacteria bacterium]|nr:hypothetical protein [Candidatus Sungbacteria bacterium]
MLRLVSSLILLGLSAALIYLGLVPQWSSVTAARNEIGRLQSLQAELIQLEDQRDKLTQEYNAISESDLQKIRSIAPSGEETSALMVDLEAIAKRSQTTLQSVDFTGREAAAIAPLAGAGDTAYTPVLVNIGAQGSYESLVQFLRGVERNLRLVDVVEINFGGIPGGVVGSRILSAVFKGNIYYRR